MLIRIREKDGVHLTIPLPTGLIFNRFTATIAVRTAAEGGVNVTPEQLKKLFRVLRDCKRRHPDWVLAEVHSADGDEVYVKL